MMMIIIIIIIMIGNITTTTTTSTTTATIITTSLPPILQVSSSMQCGQPGCGRWMRLVFARFCIALHLELFCW